ncbi:dehydrogenase/reductase SDR family protein 7-like [Neocloeon triangulifer]|uniref:dehydrogenase/reductase SDR family protein 7-like n=1 Tax=Neocloeon triangulifer TaxID=2078957 RepID=UPI00286F2962|nr:dehydrogenase/reductase SDR family protein 7-like [Neocloeon triangulifer]
MTFRARSELVQLWGGWKSIFSSLASITAVGWIINKFLQMRQKTQCIRQLQNKVVLITGASSGIGEALAHAFYRAGCQVVLAARREDELQRVREDLIHSHETGPTHLPVILPLDVSELNEIPSKMESLLAIHKKVDILLSCAGIGSRSSVMDCSVDIDIRVMLINYFGHVALTKALLPHMIKEQSGHIVAVSSIQGRIALPNRAAYSASKHAMQAFSDSLRAEVSDKGIKVTVVSPGYVKTNISMNALNAQGQACQVMDENIAKGMSSEYVADRILEAVALGTKEVEIAPLLHRLAIVLRVLAPDLFAYIMKKRA